jgi:hypothetical protein
MTTFKKVLIGMSLLAMLLLGALGGVGLSLPGYNPAVPAAHADGCDSVPPPPGLDCPPTPTPTPKN